MKKSIISLIFCFSISMGFSQIIIKDLKVKTPENATDRTTMLDIFRAEVYKYHKYELIFVVNHFKMGNNYAWFMGEAQRKDGKQLILEDFEDCCHVEALFKKTGGKWQIVESAAFSTDVWYQGIAKKYPAAPKSIFGDTGAIY